MKVVDLNCDMGESRVGSYAGIVKHVTSASIACGFHAGSHGLMSETIALCKRNGVDVGAHPSFLDREGFGRKLVELGQKELESLVLYQVGALEALAEAKSVEVRHIKAHGALYNMAQVRRDYAEVMARVSLALGKILVAPENSMMRKEGEALGVKVAYEGFADRGYTSDGRLAARGKPGALITDPEEAADRSLRMVDGKPIRTVDGKMLSLNVTTICVHGDTPGAERIARAVRAGLEGAGVRVVPMREIV